MRALVLLLAVASLWTPCAGANQFALYNEPYRPGFHYTPEVNWTSEPNGLVYHDGLYHLFYQANPFDNSFGNQTWGHATSADLVHWNQQPAAITPDPEILAFSGSTVVDTQNTAGFGAGALVAAYTGFKPSDGTQDQRLAYSTDGINFTKYSSNPVIPRLPGGEANETRSPKVFWHDDSSSWKMVLAHGGQQKASFWTSSNLKNWLRTDNFFANDISGQVGAWESPDFFELPVLDPSGADTGVDRWVLSTTPSSGSPAGGDGVNYFVGEYDGVTFTNQNPAGTLLWADYGRDFDGQQSWSNTPDGRVIWTSVMQSYGSSTPTVPWRGQMAIPREVSLVDFGSGPRIVQQPITELQTLRGTTSSFNNITVNSSAMSPIPGLNLQQGEMLEIIATIDPGTATSVGLRVREGGNGDVTSYGYYPLSNELFVDRTASGDSSFNAAVSDLQTAPLTTDANGHVQLRAFIDRGSIEVFGGIGETVVSNLIFPDPTSQGVSLFSNGGQAEFVSIEIHELNSIWEAGPPPVAGGPAVARWKMDRSPQGIGAPWLGPVSIDSRARFGEGVEAGLGGSTFESNPAVENLFSTVLTSTGTGIMPIGTDVPPPSMFTPGNDGGDASYNAGAIAALDGSLKLRADISGDDAAFDDAFSIEMFFKTDGDQSGVGLMQLLLQGDSSFRYGLVVNEGGAGNVRFAIDDKAGQAPSVDINSVSARNYADGEWHYLLATYDPDAGLNGELALTIANEDGTADTATLTINTLFSGLPSGGDGDLLIGRENEDRFTSPRTFRGLIDEVQLTAGLVPDALRLGALPGDQILPGDYNADGIVDAADFAVWRDTEGQAVAFFGAGADGNGNGVVDAEDGEIWASNLGAQLPVPLAGVPEPAGGVLFVVASWFSITASSYVYRNVRC